MEIKRGIAVSPGVAIGPALVLDTEWYRIPKRQIAPAESASECQRLHQALDRAARETENHQKAISDKLGSHYGSIFGAHALMIRDPALAEEIDQLIRKEHFAVEYAVSRVIRRYVKTLESIEGDFVHSRINDLYDIERRILEQLLGQRREHLKEMKSPVIVIAHDLTPSETANFDTRIVNAFATEAGGRASHSAIIAGVLEIPAVVGLGRFTTDVSGGDLVIVDGNRGLVIINPDDETLARYERTRTSLRTHESHLQEQRNLESVTEDGVAIPLYGNIEFPTETTACLERGAAGVGLYRTEFLYLGRKDDPTETEHFEAYMNVARKMGPNRPLVIRTLDLGADKFNPRSEYVANERNPFLGLRSVRLCLRNLTLFKTQMRAILRASAFGDVRIMFPMISTLLELRQCKMILAEVKEDLEEEGIPFNSRIPIGTMIEVPSAAILAETLAKEVDFFSIGTNDLVQYTLAADRDNEAVASIYTPGDPAVLRLIDFVVKAAQKEGISVNVCGEMSGEPQYALLLVGMGLRQLSLTPHNIPEIKRLIRAVSVKETEAVAREALQLETARDVNHYLREQTRRILPEVMN